jgi:hypothetical protein
MEQATIQNLVSRCIRPPFSEDLIKNTKALFLSVNNTATFSTILSRGPLADEIGLGELRPFPRKLSFSPDEPNYFS